VGATIAAAPVNSSTSDETHVRCSTRTTHSSAPLANRADLRHAALRPADPAQGDHRAVVNDPLTAKNRDGLRWGRDPPMNEPETYPAVAGWSCPIPLWADAAPRAPE